MLCTVEEKKRKRKEFEHLKRIGEFKLKGECRTCGKKGNTCFHHLIPLSMSRGTNSSTNVIEVCYECHSQIHGGLKFITADRPNQKKAVRKSNTKMIKVKYDFSSINKDIVGVEECKGNNASVDIINNIIKRVNNSNTYMKWSQTSSNTYAPYGARKTINSGLKPYDNDYRMYRKDFEQGYIEVYIPNKRGIA